MLIPRTKLTPGKIPWTHQYSTEVSVQYISITAKGIWEKYPNPPRVWFEFGFNFGTRVAVIQLVYFSGYTVLNPLKSKALFVFKKKNLTKLCCELQFNISTMTAWFFYLMV